MCKRNIHRLPLACPRPGTWPITQACALTGNHTNNLLVHRQAFNPLSHISQGFLGLKKIYLMNLLGWHWLIKLYRFQVYSSIIHNVCSPSQVKFTPPPPCPLLSPPITAKTLPFYLFDYCLFLPPGSSGPTLGRKCLKPHVLTSTPTSTHVRRSRENSGGEGQRITHSELEPVPFWKINICYNFIKLMDCSEVPRALGLPRHWQTSAHTVEGDPAWKSHDTFLQGAQEFQKVSFTFFYTTGRCAEIPASLHIY